MGQLALMFPDDEGSPLMNSSKAIVPSPDLARVLREIEMEEELARLSPEDRQRHWARRADEERRRVRQTRE